MRILVLATLIISGCATLQPGEGEALVALGADVGTSYAGIQGHEAEELNPLYGSGQEAVVTSAVVGLVLHYMIRGWLQNQPERVQLKTWRYVSFVRFTVAGWNAGQIAR